MLLKAITNYAYILFTVRVCENTHASTTPFVNSNTNSAESVMVGCCWAGWSQASWLFLRLARRKPHCLRRDIAPVRSLSALYCSRVCQTACVWENVINGLNVNSSNGRHYHVLIMFVRDWSTLLGFPKQLNLMEDNQYVFYTYPVQLQE